MDMESRPQRFSTLINQTRDIVADSEGLKEEYQMWLDNMPENLEQSRTGDKLNETIDALDNFIQSLEDASGELEGIELPLGFCND